MQIDITEASLAQASVVHRIMRAAFAMYSAESYPPFAAHTETIDDVADAIRAGGAIILWADRQPIGSARYRLCDGVFVIERVSVLPDYQGQGLARLMMNYLEQLALVYGYHQTELCSRTSLERNLKFYRNLGYDVYDVNPHSGRVTMHKDVVNLGMEWEYA